MIAEIVAVRRTVKCLNLFCPPDGIMSEMVDI